MRSRDPLAVGRRLRYELAEIMKPLIIENAKDGIRTVPVVDSALVGVPEDAFERHRAEFRTAWRLGAPIAEITGIAARIVGTNGEDYIFHLVRPHRLSTGARNMITAKPDPKKQHANRASKPNNPTANHPILWLPRLPSTCHVFS